MYLETFGSIHSCCLPRIFNIFQVFFSTKCSRVRRLSHEISIGAQKLVQTVTSIPKKIKHQEVFDWADILSPYIFPTLECFFTFVLDIRLMSLIINSNLSSFLFSCHGSVSYLWLVTIHYTSDKFETHLFNVFPGSPCVLAIFFFSPLVSYGVMAILFPLVWTVFLLPFFSRTKTHIH